MFRSQSLESDRENRHVAALGVELQGDRPARKTGRLGFIQADRETLHLHGHGRPGGAIAARLSSPGLLCRSGRSRGRPLRRLGNSETGPKACDGDCGQSIPRQLTVHPKTTDEPPYPVPEGAILRNNRLAILVESYRLATKRSPPPGHILVHNRVETTPTTDQGTRGFRAWWTTPGTEFVPCDCGWRLDLGRSSGPHVSLRDAGGAGLGRRPRPITDASQRRTRSARCDSRGSPPSGR
jgi:hypothetical protein